jgi:hypothetical protein
MRKTSIFVIVAFVVSACATTPNMRWVRADGQRSADNPAVRTQFELDSTSCLGERNKAALSGVTVAGGGLAGMAAAIDRSNAADTVARGCMAEKGYLLVPEDQAEAKRAELAAIAQQQKTQAAPPPPPPPSKARTVVAPPPKQVPRGVPVPTQPVVGASPATSPAATAPEPTMSEADRMMNSRN